MRFPIAVPALVLLLVALHDLARGDTPGASVPAGAASPTAAAPPRPPAPRRPTAHEVVGSSALAACPCFVMTPTDTGLPEPGTRVALGALYQSDTRIGAGLGDYSAARAMFEVRSARNLSSSLQFVGELSAERGTFEFTDPAALVPLGTGDLGGEMTGVLVGLGCSWRVSRSFGLSLAGTARWLWMDGADMADGFQPGAVVAVRLRLFGATDVFVGGSFTTGLEGDPSLLPVLGLGGVSTGEGSRWHVQARGAGVSVTYDLTSCLSVGLFGGYERRDVRLAPDDRLPDGVLRERRLPLGLELGWKPRRGSIVVLTAGASVWNRITLLDSAGTRVREETTDPAPFVHLEWSARF